MNQPEPTPNNTYPVDRTSVPWPPSIVIPCYNEEAVIEATHARICSIATHLGMELEVLYVDDGSQTVLSKN